MAPDNSFVQALGAGRQLAYVGADLNLPAGTAFGSNATVTSNLMNSQGAKTLSVSGTASQAGNMVLTTYLDAAGSVVQETITTALTAATAGLCQTSVNKPFQTWKLAYTNTNTTAGTFGVNAALAQN